MTLKLPTTDEVLALREEQGIGLNDARILLTKEAVIESISEATSFEQAKDALMYLARNAVLR